MTGSRIPLSIQIPVAASTGEILLWSIKAGGVATERTGQGQVT